MAATEKDSGQIWPNDAGFTATAECLKPVELAVRGTIPARVAGTLYRTGPGTGKVAGSSFELSHWFDGFSHLHRFQLVAQPDGKTCRVWYNSRRQNDALIDEARRTGRLEGISFGQKRDPCESLFQKMKTVFCGPRQPDDPGLANVGVTVRANSPAFPKALLKETSGSGSARRIESLTCSTDATTAKHLDPETLEPLALARQHTLHPDLKGPLSSAHAEYDSETGDLYNFNLDLGMGPLVGPVYRIFRTDAATGQTEIVAAITGQPPAYIHSFFLTRDYVILCIWPAVFVAGGIRILWDRNLMDAFGFDASAQARWCVIDRRPGGRGHVATYLSPAFFCFHTVNAWQDDSDGSIYCDLVQYPDTRVLHGMYYENMMSSAVADKKKAGNAWTADSPPSLVRYKLAGAANNDTATNAPDNHCRTAEILWRIDNRAAVGDLPAVNPRFRNCRRTRYVYTCVNRGLSSFFDGLAKVDTDTGETIVWSADHHTPGEAIFIPADGTDDEDEDAGYILSVVLDGDAGTSYLVCLDARDMSEIGRADCGLPVGFGFHGTHIPASD